MIVFNETVKRDKILPLDYLNLYIRDLMRAKTGSLCTHILTSEGLCSNGILK